jgi:hypothetical protein
MPRLASQVVITVVFLIRIGGGRWQTRTLTWLGRSSLSSR